MLGNAIIVRDPAYDLDCRIDRRIIIGNRGGKLAKLRGLNHKSRIGAGILIPTLAHARIMTALKNQQDATFHAKVEPLGMMFELGEERLGFTTIGAMRPAIRCKPKRHPAKMFQRAAA